MTTEKHPESVEKGLFEKLTFESTVKKGELIISIHSEPLKSLSSSDKKIELIIHNMAKPKKIKGFSHTSDEVKKITRIPVVLKGSGKQIIRIKI
ncbi:MAG: hypothetical protein U5K51_02060 [Flavobacteriaceae bacterium]|nr:hypothetical protein [Flavobacteriaceae bacterium]